jgi:hypothetical protein
VRREIPRSDRRLRVWPAVERLRGRRGPTSDGCDGCDGLRAHGEASFTKRRRRRSRRARLRGLALELGRARTAGGGDFFLRFRAWGLSLRLRLRESRISIAEAKRKRGRRSATGDLCGSGPETLGPRLEPCLRGRSHGELARPAAVGHGESHGERERERERERDVKFAERSGAEFLIRALPVASIEGLDPRRFGVCSGASLVAGIGRECRLSDGGIPYNPSPYNKALPLVASITPRWEYKGGIGGISSGVIPPTPPTITRSSLCGSSIWIRFSPPRK